VARTFKVGGTLVACVALGVVFAALALAAPGTARLHGAQLVPAKRSVAHAASLSPAEEANRSAAEVDASQLLSKLQLPAAATPSAIEPKEANGELASAEGEGEDPWLTDDHEWWTTPEKPTEVIAYVNGHLPLGSLPGGGVTWGSGKLERSYGFAPLPNVEISREIQLTVVPFAGGGSGIRADARTEWDVPRPAAEHFPTTARQLRISVYPGLNHRRVPPIIRIVSKAKIGRAATVLNTLSVEQRWGAVACPSDEGTYVKVAFFARSLSRPVAAARLYVGGCSYVAVTVRGKRYPDLQFDQPVRRLERAIGERIRY